jgi:predicted amino acid racemase
MKDKSALCVSGVTLSSDLCVSAYPRLICCLKDIEENTRLICRLANAKGMSVTGITKACCGEPQIAKAMLRGGVTSLGDSRVENLRRLRDAGISSELWAIRSPMLSEAMDVVRFADLSLNSELVVLKRLSKIALQLGTRHLVILMVEMGDLREGLCREELTGMISAIRTLLGVELCGLGMNLACLGGVRPTPEKIGEFSEIVSEVREVFDMPLKIISGGNSANIPLLLAEGDDAHHVNHLRVGEAILLGCDSVMRRPIPGAHQDAFVLECQIIELKNKPSFPQGDIAQDAYGRRPSFEDIGSISRGLLAIGKQDVLIEGLTPIDPSVTILGASSDHISVRFQTEAYRVGDIVKFRVNYGALAQLFVSPYVRKVMI